MEQTQCTKEGKSLTAIIAASKIGNVPIVSKILQVTDIKNDYSKLFAAKDYKKNFAIRDRENNCLEACIWADQKASGNKFIKFVKATTITSKGVEPDRKKVKIILRNAIQMLDAEEAKILLDNANNAENEKKMNDRKEEEKLKQLKLAEDAEKLESFNERKKYIEQEKNELMNLLPREQNKEDNKEEKKE